MRCWLNAGIEPDRDGVTLAPVPGSGEPGVSFGVHAAQALRDGVIDGFWANAMGAEVSVRSGIGTVVLDPRQGLGPPEARDYTFAALVTTDRLIEDSPATAEGAVRAVVQAQRALRADPSRAAEVGRRLFPPDEAALIEDLVRRDAPFYTAVKSPLSPRPASTSSADISAGSLATWLIGRWWPAGLLISGTNSRCVL